MTGEKAQYHQYPASYVWKALSHIRRVPFPVRRRSFPKAYKAAREGVVGSR